MINVATDVSNVVLMEEIWKEIMKTGISTTPDVSPPKEPKPDAGKE